MSESLDRPVLLSAASNQAVVQLPGRRFPGSVIQGDSLSYLYVLACAVENHAVDTPNDALIEAARELRELLEGRLRAYDEVLSQNKIERPYKRPMWRNMDAGE